MHGTRLEPALGAFPLPQPPSSFVGLTVYLSCLFFYMSVSLYLLRACLCFLQVSRRHMP